MATVRPFLHVLLCFIYLLSVSTNLNQAVDTLSFNHSLSGNETLVSSRGNFVLGFFQPVNSSRYYLGIWYNTIKVTVFTQVWVANRERSLSDPSTSELRITSNGNMVLLNEFRAIVWSTNTAFNSSDSLVAVIQDDGNFVLSTRRESFNSSSVLWQSFDHLSDTWLPGSKLMFNKLTKEIIGITSWKSSIDPTPGMYSFFPDRTGLKQFVRFWNNSVVYWSSGLWNGIGFDNAPAMTIGGQSWCTIECHNIGQFSETTLVFNKNETSCTYAPREVSYYIARHVLSISGQLELSIWVANAGWNLIYSEPKVCKVYRVCGPFGSCNERSLPSCNCFRGFSQVSIKDWEFRDYTLGCMRNTALHCGKKISTDIFYEMEDVHFPHDPQTSTVRTKTDCESACLRNCSCTAYSYNSSCYLWFGNLLNLQQLYDRSGDTLYLRLASSELQSSKRNKNLLLAVIVAAIGVGFISCLALTWVLICRRRLSIRVSRDMGNNLVLYNYAELKRITKSFSEQLGEGGSGSVFKGMVSLPNSSVLVAVKKLKGIHQGDKQFRAEVSTLGTIQHVNLVHLRGFCSEGSKRLLVYDYMPNGSLAYQLFHNLESVLDWNTRYRIALGTARGLVYLHETCRDCIIHCDIKPENILLDSSFEPKVADFGLAKLVGRDFSRVLTTMRGTIGYLAPEWISGVAVTTKADVYSYGLMLFEIISGKRNWGSETCSVYFPIYAASKIREGAVLSILDPRLEGSANVEDLTRACLAACWCIQDDESSRPTMGQVVQILEKVLEVEMPPIPRLLQRLAENNSCRIG